MRMNIFKVAWICYVHTTSFDTVNTFVQQYMVALTDALYCSTASSARHRLSSLRVLALRIFSFACCRSYTFRSTTTTRAPVAKAPPVSTKAVRLSNSAPRTRCLTSSMAAPVCRDTTGGSTLWRYSADSEVGGVKVPLIRTDAPDNV